MPSYRAGFAMSNHALITLTDALRQRRSQLGTRWRRLTVGHQALLVLAHLRKGETYADLATGFGIGTTTAFRYIREALEVLAALAPSLHDAVAVATRKAFVIIDGTLLRIDRVGMGSGRDRPYFSGKHKAHGVNVQVLADPTGRLIWASPALPGARHDMGARPRTRHPRRPHRSQSAGDRRQRLPRLRIHRSPPSPPRQPRDRPASPALQQSESGQLRPRPSTRTRRAGQRATQELEDPPQDPLLPPPRHRPRQGRPRPHPRRLTASGKGSMVIARPDRAAVVAAVGRGGS